LKETNIFERKRNTKHDIDLDMNNNSMNMISGGKKKNQRKMIVDGASNNNGGKSRKQHNNINNNSNSNSRHQNANNKRQCPNCGTATHKKAGILGKKSVPITVEGKVYQGRCLSCDPFPVAAASSPSPTTKTKTAVVASAAAVDDVHQRKKNPPVIRHNNDNNYDNSPSSSSSSSSSPRQQQQQQPLSYPPTATITADVGSLDVTTTTATIPTEKNLQQHQQQQRLETISGLPPRGQQRTQTQNHRLEQNSDENVDNIDSRIQQQQQQRQQQQQQQQQQQRIEHTINNNNNNNNPGMNIDARAAGPAAINVGVPKTLEVVHRSDRRPINNNNNNNNNNSSGSGNNSDNDNISSGGGGGAFSDDHSIVSAITMDIHLSQPYYEEDYIIPPQRRHRPGPERSTNNSASSANDNDFHNNNNNNNNNTGDDIGHQMNHNHNHRRHRRHPSSSNSNNNDDDNNNNNRHRYESSELFRPPPMSSSAAAAEEAVIISREHRHNNNKDIEFRLPDDDGDNNDNDFPTFIMDDYDCNHDRNYPQQQYSQNDLTTKVVNASLSNIEHITMPQAPGLSSSSAAAGRDKDESKNEEVDDISEIFRCLLKNECNPDNRVQALSSLGNILRSYSGDKREFIVDHNVIETVTKSMWADMEIKEVQEAAMNLLFVIATSTASNTNNDNDSGDMMNNMLSKKESVCDSILFTMQNHATVSAIQLKGCLIFASLAATSSDNKNNSDGSLSGAMNMVLNAMSNHGGSRKAGLQAIHHQCLLSVHAEDNKRRLIEIKLENGISGIDVIIYAMEELQQDSAAMEWACELSWCMTSSKELLKHFKDTSLHEPIVSICQHYIKNPIMVSLIEACIGTIANLAHLENKRNEFINLGAFELILDGLRHHGNNLGICYEATVALENFVLSSNIQDSIGKSEAVAMVVRVLDDMDSPKYTGVAFRALACMAAHSQEAKEIIGTEEIINIVHESSSIYNDNSNVQEQFATFIATLAIGSEPISDLMIKHGVVDILLDVMNRFPQEKVQDAACLAFRNISSQIQKSDPLLRRGDTSKYIVSAMEAYRNSVSIQTSACCIFWNMLSKTEEKELAVNPQTVDSIIKAMQSHIESGDLLELACGALWVFVDSFDDQKLVVGNKAIDAVACAMVMHPNNTSTLENACGFLSNLSSEKSLAEAIATVQGVSIVAEAMRNNGNSIALIEIGCLTLKNITSMFPSFVQDASVAISSVINAMKDNVKSTSFMKEACDLIWVLSSEEDNIRSKILALDGISILMKCLEQNSDDPEVQTSALRAFNQLAKSNTQNGV